MTRQVHKQITDTLSVSNVGERVNGFLDEVCRPEGFTVAQFENYVGFRLGYKTTNKGWRRLRAPPHFRFVNLNTQVGRTFNDPNKFCFALGLARTKYDPPGGRTTNFWSHDIPQTGIRTDRVTGHIGFDLTVGEHERLRVRTLQSTAILKDDQDIVTYQLKAMKDTKFPGGTGKIQTRIANNEKLCIPWAFEERLVACFDPLTIKLVRDLGIGRVYVFPEISEESVYSRNYGRFIHVFEKLPHEGITLDTPSTCREDYHPPKHQ